MHVYRRNVSKDQNNLEEENNNINFYNQPTKSSQITNMAAINCRDRTSEFHSTIRAFQTRVTTKVPLANGKSNQSIQQRTHFMNRAKRIGGELTSTCAKLEKLTSLAKKRTLFDDKPAEIQELTYIIKQDINILNKEIISLQQLVRTYQNQSNKNVQKHSNNVVITLQSKLATMSKSFENVLKVRSENLKKQSDRKEQFGNTGNFTAMSLKGPKPSGQMGRSILLEESDANNSETVINMDTDAKNQYKQQLLLMDEQDKFISERANAMESIEQTIVDLGSIYQQLATLIKEQDEVIQRIDHNVDETEMNVTAAHGELLKYFQSVTSNRWLIIKIFLVLIVFFVIFVIFAA